jgi:hypothetical protein
MLILTRLALLCWQNSEQLNQPNRRGTDPYARWCDRESPRGPTYVDLDLPSRQGPKKAQKGDAANGIERKANSYLLRKQGVEETDLQNFERKV